MYFCQKVIAKVDRLLSVGFVVWQQKTTHTLLLILLEVYTMNLKVYFDKFMGLPAP